MNQNLQKNRYDLEEAKESWQQEPDDKRVLRAATEDIDEYPPEIQTIIKEEAERRIKTKVITTRVSIPVGIAESVGASLSIVFFGVIAKLVFGGNWAELSGMAGIMIVAALIKIWKPKRSVEIDEAKTSPDN